MKVIGYGVLSVLKIDWWNDQKDSMWKILLDIGVQYVIIFK